MKNKSHHLKNIQKEIIRAVRKENSKNLNHVNLSGNDSFSSPTQMMEVYDEVIPANQQVPRANRRNMHY